MARKPKTWLDMVNESYADQEVCDFIAEQVRTNNTGPKIESGELTLPSETDAINAHNGTHAREEAERQARRR